MAVDQHPAQQVLAERVALIGRLASPIQGLFLVFLHTAAVQIEDRDFGLRARIALFGMRQKFSEGRFEVALFQEFHGPFHIGLRHTRQRQNRHRRSQNQ